MMYCCSSSDVLVSRPGSLSQHSRFRLLPHVTGTDTNTDTDINTDTDTNTDTDSNVDTILLEKTHAN